MKLAVTDANIFIDLIKLQMLALLFNIDIEIHTTKEIVDQLNDQQATHLTQFIDAHHLQVHYLTAHQLQAIIALPAPQALELADKSAAWLSLQLAATVLTGDGPLRKYCQTQHLQVKGIIWLFDVIVEKGLLHPVTAAHKMEALLQFNNRLPKDECSHRIHQWRGKTLELVIQ
jgi:predicted nucleic acid-binding protein